MEMFTYPFIVRAFAAGVLQQCKSRWSLPRRWYNHWIQCLY